MRREGIPACAGNLGPLFKDILIPHGDKSPGPKIIWDGFGKTKTPNTDFFENSDDSANDRPSVEGPTDHEPPSDDGRSTARNSFPFVCKRDGVALCGEKVGKQPDEVPAIPCRLCSGSVGWPSSFCLSSHQKPPRVDFQAGNDMGRFWKNKNSK